MERIKPTGVYGYLGRHLLRMASKSGTYIYYTENKDLIEDLNSAAQFLVKLQVSEKQSSQNTWICQKFHLS